MNIPSTFHQAILNPASFNDFLSTQAIEKQNLLQWVVQEGLGHVIDWALTDNLLSCDDCFCGLLAAARHDRPDIARQLLTVSVPSPDKEHVMRAAVLSGANDVLDLLLNASTYTLAAYTSVLTTAAESGNEHAVRALLPLGDARARDSLPLRDAVATGNLTIVSLLIPHSDARAVDSKALKKAVKLGYQDLVEVLVPVSDSALLYHRYLQFHQWALADLLGVFLDPSEWDRGLRLAPPGALPLISSRLTRLWLTQALGPPPERAVKGKGRL